MKVSVILKGRTDQQGKQPLQIRVQDGKLRRFIPTKIKVLPVDFDPVKGQVKISHPHAKDINKRLSLRVLQVESGVYKTESNQAVPFINYCTKCLNEWDKVKAWNTLRGMQSEVNKLRRFAPNVLLSEVTPAFLASYQAHLFSLGNANNTVWDAFKFIKTVILKAMREKLISEDPFTAFKRPVYKDPSIIYLTKDQVDRIAEVAANDSYRPEIIFCATWFVIGCYIGIRFGDMEAFDREKNIRNGRLVVKTQKTGEVISFELSDRVVQLFESIDYRPMSYANQHYNRVLKQIAAYAGIKENITAHTSRHTFGTMALNSGISMEMVAQLMGHRNTKITRLYAKFANPLIDSEMKKMG